MGAKKKTSVGLLVFGSFMHQTNLAELVTGCGVTVITFMSLNNKFLQLYYIMNSDSEDITSSLMHGFQYLNNNSADTISDGL